ncbi:type VI secretion system baseplate subunit TssG [Corallococcus sp. BB11-1]|uniref:type VI secretion system baseplate subunit TssG n=1 Tax=Corallococcus sp. BB11-1 TaxID=2996783 RepID=UPI00226E18BA|nr:type VI secretion system baseplate subunit TssG [Corallococcus sp. BB11-1]MCY1033883.1 type VI secretion system baseplate subunit TssG [Corallococcus sp. BB11-1]
MAGKGWGTDCPVVEELHEQPRQFSFIQAVRLLELSNPRAPRVGEGTDPDTEPVRLCASADMAFSSSDVVALKPQRLDPVTGKALPPELTVGSLSLMGARGALPLPMAQWIRDRERRGDVGPRNFLDLFHHRLLALRYRAKVARRVALDPRPPEQHLVASWLFALLGLGTPGLRERNPTLPSRVLLRYAGALARRPRSMATLEAVLRDYFSVEVKGHAFEGAWLALDAEQQTRLGQSGRNQRMGEAVLGQRVWDWQARFRLTLGPLRQGQLEDFLPHGRGLEVLRELVRFVVGPSMDFHLELWVKPEEVPRARLGQARLGWNAWLPAPGREEAGRVTLSTRFTRAAAPEGRAP